MMATLKRFFSGSAATTAALAAYLSIQGKAEALELDSSIENFQKKEDELKLVQVVFRHGARAPLAKKYWPRLVEKWDVCGQAYAPVPVVIMAENGSPRPKNSHNESQIATKFLGGCHKGELTRLGQNQARELGDWLRQRYVYRMQFLPEKYEPESLFCRTTNYSRTVATLQGVITGLYPGLKQPVHVYTTEEMDEILFGNAEACDRLSNLIKEMALQAKKETPSPELQEIQERINHALNLHPSERIDFLDLHDVVTTMLHHNKPLPEGMLDPELLKTIEEQASKRFSMFVAGSSSNKEILRLGMGRLLHLLLIRMQEAAQLEKSSTPSMFLYSGHDSTIMPLLAALGMRSDNHWPAYASSIVFELWKSAHDGEHYVKILYNKEELPIYGRSTCTLRTLKEHVLEPLTVSHDEREKECLLHFSHDRPAGQHVKETVTIGSSISEE